MREYIHNYAINLEHELKRLKDSSLSEKNKELVFKFYEHNLAKGISIPRLERQMSVLRKTGDWLKKDFGLVAKEYFTKNHVLAIVKQKSKEDGTSEKDSRLHKKQRELFYFFSCFFLK